ALCRADVLNLPEAAEKEQEAQLQAVCRWLRENRRWLLVFDSVDSAEAAQAVRGLLSPQWAGHVIITSRRSDWPSTMFLPLSVDVLGEEEAARFLCGRSRARGFDPGPEADPRAVARELGGLPLALEQAAAYVQRHRITFAEYLARLKKSRPELLKEEVPGYPKSVAETWLVSEEQLSVPARAILRLAAFLAPDDIPRALFASDSKVLQEAVRGLASERGRKRAKPPNSVDSESALVELADHSLITLTPKAFSCHRLVQAVQADRLDPDTLRQWTELALRLVDECVPVNTDDVRTWPVMQSVRAHAETVVAHADKLAITQPTARLVSQLGNFLYARALHREAEPLMRQALAIDELSFGPRHPNVASALNNLALLLKATNRLGEAEPLMRRALAVAEQSFGPQHPNVATALNNLAALLQATNRLAEAEPLMRRAVAVDEQTLGPYHPHVARDLNNLAALLQDTNRLVEAEPLMRRALVIDERSFGQDHPYVANDLNSLAALLQASNRLAEAEPLMRRALAIWAQSLGENHPNVASALSNLGQLLEVTNRPEEAEPLMRRALAIDEKCFGQDHPSVAIRLNNLAALLHATNRLAEAEPLMRRALAVDEKSLGPDHPNVARDLNNLAQLLKAANRLGEAEPLIRRHVVIFRKFRESTGHEHPHMKAAIRNYTALLKAMGLPEEEIRRRVQEAAGRC
ncbi:MAG: tetratricopeptide repeat protein, partial [Planctomycetes bacterium]|nr:tetratricopeptide repeat protein [Planctomycetota bacterium]